MDGGFLVDDLFAIHPAVGGGNLLLLGTDSSATLPAAEAAVGAMKDVADGILSRRVCRRPADGTVSPAGAAAQDRYPALGPLASIARFSDLRHIRTS